MTCRCFNLLLLVFLTLIHPSEQDCNENFNLEYWFSLENPLPPVQLIRTNNSMDVLECSLERMCIEQEVCDSLATKCKEKHENACTSEENMCLHGKLKVCYILDRCFERKIVSQISEKCEGESYKSVKMVHLLCWLAQAKADKLPDYCDDYDELCDTYSNMSFPPRTGQTATRKSSPENLTLIVMTISLIMNGLLLVHLYFRRRTVQQNGVNGGSFQTDLESQSRIDLDNTTGGEEAVPLQLLNNTLQA